jgi:hypothetical protein
MMKKIGATPGKLALIGVLAVVLVTVIASQLPNRSTSTTVALNSSTPSRTEPTRQSVSDQRKTRSAGSKPSNTKVKSSDAPENQSPHVWPKLSIDQIATYDPLVAPDWLIAARNAIPPKDKKSQQLAETERQKRNTAALKILREQGTKAVVISAGEKRALIGEQPVHIGDNIEGFQITDITKQGVVLTETE